MSLPEEKRARWIEPCGICGRDPDDCICLPSQLDLDDPDWDDEDWSDEETE